MAETAIIARFEADLTGLEKAVGSVNKVASQTEKAFEKSNSAIASSAKKLEGVFQRLGDNGRAQLQKIADTEKIQAGFAAMGAAGKTHLEAVTTKTTNLKKAFQDAGQGARRLGLLIGGVFGDLIFYGGEALSAIKGIATGLISVVSPVGAVVGGLAAAAVGLHIFRDRARQAAAEAKVLEQNAGTLKLALDKFGKESDESRTRIESLKLLREEAQKTLTELNRPGRSPGKFDDERRAAAANDILAIDKELVLEEGKLSRIREGQSDTRLLVVQDELSKQLLKLERAYQTGGERIDFYTGQVSAYEDAIEKASEIDGVADEVLKDLNNSRKESIRQLELETEATKDLEQAREDSLLPAGSASPVEQPRGLIAGFAGPQVALPQEKEISSLVVALETAQEQIQVTAQTVGHAIGNTFQMLAQGIGDSVAAAIVYGASLSEALLNILKAVAAQVISSLIQLGVQQLINLVVGQVVALQRTVAELSSYAAITYAAAFASTAAIPFVGPAIAGGVATAAVASMLSGAAGAAASGAAAGAAIGSGFAAFAEGGVVTSPVMGLVGEAGPEAILPLSKLDGLMGHGEITIHNYLTLDGRVAAKSVTKHQPGVIRRKIGPV